MKPGAKKKTATPKGGADKPDAETVAMMFCAHALSPLDEAAKARVIKWCELRFVQGPLEWRINVAAMEDLNKARREIATLKKRAEFAELKLERIAKRPAPPKVDA